VADLVEYAKKTAARNLKDPSLQTSLRRWWVRKYGLPWTSPHAQQQTEAELLVEFYEDWFHEHPEERRKVLSKDGEFYFEETGDEQIDKWEKELAMGLEPDLEEGLAPAAREQLKKEREKSGHRRQSVRTFAKEFKAKQVVRGSSEEKELLGKRQPQTKPPGVLGDDNEWVDLMTLGEEPRG
jgi:hypothetical protein